MVIRAVRAVLSEEPYHSRFTLDVLGWETEKGRRAQTAYCFGRERHGFVVLSAEGTPVACRAGHDYGEAEIRADLDRVLRR